MAIRFTRRLTGFIFAAACVLATVLIVHAALTRILGPTTVHNEPKLFVGLGGAFDSVNNVHLVVWGTQSPGPLNGLFLNADGAALGAAFPISSGPEQAGWGSVVYSPEQQRFLVSYTKILGSSSHQRAFKLLTYNGSGGPSFLTNETILANFARAFGDPPSVAYSPGAGVFMVTWHHDDFNSPTFGDRRPRSYVAPVSPTGVVLGFTELTHPDDGQSDPQIACNASGRCLVMGFAWGQFAGAIASVWGRYIDGPGATAVGPTSFYIATAPAQFEPTLVYSPGSGLWLAAFTRDLKSVWGRMLDANGGMGPVVLIKQSAGESSPDGGGFGLPSLSYNPSSSTMMLAMGSWAGLACAQELDAFGGLIGATDCVPGSIGATNYTGSVADPTASRFVMLDNQSFNRIRSTVFSVGGGPGGQAPTITNHPISHTIVAGASTVLSVAASGSAPFSYQWYQGHSPSTGAPIPGANSDTYVTPALGSTTRYWVQVANAHGGANSNTATVTPTHVFNGGFSSGSAGWSMFATPDQSYIQASVVNGMMAFFRVPPPGGSNQATVFQNTGHFFNAGTGIRALFNLGNSSNVRKRISVLLTDGDFSDHAVCTFWLPPNSQLQTYGIQTHTNEAWTNASIYFYAASMGSEGGSYLIDDVILEQDATLPTSRTNCVDPKAPPTSGLPSSGNLIVNSTFDPNSIPPWVAFGALVYQVPAGVVEMIQPSGTSGAFLQQTFVPINDGEIMFAAFSLGNSSGVRKRVTVLLHDGDFSDLSVCSFWLQPGAPLASYAMLSFATKAWANATLSFYIATTGNEPWVRLDNVVLHRTPSTATVGTECLEPGGAQTVMAEALRTSRSVGSTGRPPVSDVPSRGATRPAPPATSKGGSGIDLDHNTQLIQTMDLRGVSNAAISFESFYASESGSAELQVSEDGVTWHSVMTVPASEAWLPLSVDLSPYAGRVIRLRFVRHAEASETTLQLGTWRIADIRLWK